VELQGGGQRQKSGAEFAKESIMHPYVPRSIRQLRRLLKRMPVGMLTTHTPEGASHSRPMLVHEIDEAGWLWFITDRHSRKACELSQNPHATISFQSKKGDRYVSVQGTAVVVRDDVKLKELWNPTMRAWFPHGRRDPEIALVAVRVERAEYWIVPPTRLARVVAMAAAVVKGKRQEAGKHGILDLHPALG
jgi:general stress protein 26